MARFMHCSKKLIHYLGRTSLAPSSQCHRQISHQSGRSFSTSAVRKSLFESNIIRIIRNEINYQSQFSPPHEPAVKFNSFTVDGRPGERWVTMKSKYGSNETIKIEATMFDGTEVNPKSGDVSLHITLLVDISKGEGHDLEFVCSAWPDHIEIHKAYILNREKSLYLLYTGPNIRGSNTMLRNGLAEFLKERGVNDDLSIFLHEFIMNKYKIELINWLRAVKSFVKK